MPTAPLSLDLPGPTAAIKDASGNIYFAAQDAAYVYKLSTTGVLSVFAGMGYGGYSGDGKKATDGSDRRSRRPGDRFEGQHLPGGCRGFAHPQGVADGDYFDGCRKRHQVRQSGNLRRWRSGSESQSELAGSRSRLDRAGNIYIADMTDNRVRVVNTGTTSITIAGVAIPAGYIASGGGQQPALRELPGDSANMRRRRRGDQANLTMPYGIAVDRLGNLYIADTMTRRFVLWRLGRAISRLSRAMDSPAITSTADAATVDLQLRRNYGRRRAYSPMRQATFISRTRVRTGSATW